MLKKSYTVNAAVWRYPGMAAWHFITLSQEQSSDIKVRFSALKRNWGSLPVTVTLGKTTWETSIFPDKRLGAYLLPLKADVRKKEGIASGDMVTLSLEVRSFV